MPQAGTEKRWVCTPRNAPPKEKEKRHPRLEPKISIYARINVIAFFRSAQVTRQGLNRNDRSMDRHDMPRLEWWRVSGRQNDSGWRAHTEARGVNDRLSTRPISSFGRKEAAE